MSSDIVRIASNTSSIVFSGLEQTTLLFQDDSSWGLGFQERLDSPRTLYHGFRHSVRNHGVINVTCAVILIPLWVPQLNECVLPSFNISSMLFASFRGSVPSISSPCCVHAKKSPLQSVCSADCCAPTNALIADVNLALDSANFAARSLDSRHERMILSEHFLIVRNTSLGVRSDPLSQMTALLSAPFGAVHLRFAFTCM